VDVESEVLRGEERKAAGPAKDGVEGTVCLRAAVTGSMGAFCGWAVPMPPNGVAGRRATHAGHWHGTVQMCSGGGGGWGAKPMTMEGVRAWWVGVQLMELLDQEDGSRAGWDTNEKLWEQNDEWSLRPIEALSMVGVLSKPSAGMSRAKEGPWSVRNCWGPRKE